MESQAQSMADLFFFGFVIFLLVIGYLVGSAREKSHLASLKQRERRLASMVITNLKNPPSAYQTQESFLCVGSVVIASDYFKSMVASLKAMVGGRVKTFETLLERGRREALLRMADEAQKRGARMILNVRFETSALGRGNRNNQKRLPCAEVIAYGTALR